MLKQYQKEAITALDDFCNLAQSKSLAEAFREVTGHQYLEIDESPAPYVCMRVPTGGGKTLIAAKSLRIMVNEYLNKAYHVVFWLAPSDKIVTQTLEALKDKQHFYRQILDKEFDNINVLSLKDAYRQKFDPSEELVIIVGTIQSFRVKRESKEGRKFFGENSNYYEMLKHRDITPSMENVMKMVKPIIILDEAHKSSTGLSLERLLDLDPSFILELTATPVTNTNKAKQIYASNLLYTVNASALKRESMIKLPIVLKTLDDTRLILQEGIAKRNYLEELAKLEEMHTDRYIRPINLIRAEENRGDDAFTYDKIKAILIDEMGIKEEEIAIQTGNLKEIDGIDLLNKECTIRYIITVDALKEGWDCPFAYILSVVSNMESKTAIEQLIGRVLRMPYIEEKQKEELGYSYVFVASKNFESVAEAIGDTLVKNGFEAFEAKVSIARSANSNEDVGVLGGLWGEGLYEEHQVHVGDEIDLDTLIKPTVEPYVNYNSETGNVSIVAMPTASKREDFKKNLKKMLPEQQAKALIEDIDKLEELNPTLLGKVEDLTVPYLLIEDDGLIVPFEESSVLEFITVSEADIVQNANLTLDEFDIDLKESVGTIDISSNNKIITGRIDRMDTLFPASEVNEGTAEHKYGTFQGNEVAKKLANSIAKIIRDEHEEILQVYGSPKLNEFIYFTISRLEKERKIPLQALFAKKYHLKRAILLKLVKIVSEFKIASFEKLLEVSRFSVDTNNMVTFTSDNYHPNADSRSHEFKKHKYRYVDRLDSKEEYVVAKYIDGLEDVVTWIKNIVKVPQDSFWLQTATGKFYPDFIIKLKNGKTVVAEYKGEHLKNDDTKRKEEIGDFWASQSEDYEFLMLYLDDYKEKLKDCF